MPHTTHHYRGIILLILGVCILAEIIWSWRNDKKVYQLKDTFTNIAVLAGFQFSKFLFAGYQLALLGLAADLAPFRLPANGWVFLLAFVTADFLYYWFHRISHKWQPLWAFHLIHHSSPLMNLTAAYRLNWFSALISPLFFIPAALMGLPPAFIALSYGLNLAYQFFMHTEAVGKLGPIEGILDTPSAHRVHHGSNEIYIDKNFGGVFMVWDRLFHTYQPETEKVKYGLTTGFVSHNPFVLVMHGFLELFHQTKHTIMKKVRLINRSTAVIATAAVLLLSACKKDSSSSSAVTEDDAADAITESVVTSSGGLTTQTTDAARMTNTYSSACGASKDTSISYVSAANASVSYAFNASWHWALTCTPTSHFDFTYHGHLTYDAPRMSSDDSVYATMVVTGLTGTSDYIVNLNLTRNGSQASKVRNKNTFTSVLTLTGTNVAVNKQTLLVDSGTLAVTFNGSGSGGRTFSFSGTLAFSGNKAAVLTMKSGAVYNITW